MENWIIGRILTWIGNALSGYKVYITGAASILIGITGIIGLIFPNPKLPVMTVPEIEAAFVAGGLAFGFGHKMDKNTAAIDRQTEVIATQQVASPFTTPPWSKQ
jgi:hypothetical protein